MRCTIASATKVDPAVTESLLQALNLAQAEESFGALERVESDARRHIDLGEARVIATKLKVGKGTVVRWCHEGRLEAVRASSDSKFWIRVTPEEIRKLKRTVRRTRPWKSTTALRP